MPGDFVLVVDDSRDCRELLQMTLRIFGVPVVVAPDGVKAVEVATAERPALIFMDVSMPGMDGFETAQLIQSHYWPRTVPVVAMSADVNGLSDHKRAAEAGCSALLHKPWDVEDLIRLLNRYWPGAVHSRRSRANPARQPQIH